MNQGPAPGNATPAGNGAVTGDRAVPGTNGDWVRHAVAQYERRLVTYVAHLTGDVERARDVVQETFVRLCGAKRADVEGRLAPWLYTVSRNLAIDDRRKERRMHLLNRTPADPYPSHPASRSDPAPDPSDVAERSDSVSAVLTHLAALPPVQQEVIRLKFQHGLSSRQIGEILNLTATNVGFILHTGLKTLRGRLVTGDDEVPTSRPSGARSK